jgi:signal transduction histidine kinase
MRPLTKINQLLSEKLDIKDNNFTKDHSPKEIASRNLSNKKMKPLGNFSSLINALSEIDSDQITTVNDPETVVNFDSKKRKNNILIEMLLDDDNNVLEETDLSYYLSDLVSEFEDYEGGKVSISIDKEILNCMIHKTQTKIILNNILSNALKYSLDEINIYLSVSLCTSMDGQWINFTITDSGIGMSDEQIKNIYVPFYRAQPSGYVPGNGIGMTLVKELINNLNGNIDINSHVGKGTIVSVKLKYIPILE